MSKKSLVMLLFIVLVAQLTGAAEQAKCDKSTWDRIMAYATCKGVWASGICAGIGGTIAGGAVALGAAFAASQPTMAELSRYATLEGEYRYAKLQKTGWDSYGSGGIKEFTTDALRKSEGTVGEVVPEAHRDKSVSNLSRQGQEVAEAEARLAEFEKAHPKAKANFELARAQGLLDESKGLARQTVKRVPDGAQMSRTAQAGRFVGGSAMRVLASAGGIALTAIGAVEIVGAMMNDSAASAQKRADDAYLACYKVYGAGTSYINAKLAKDGKTCEPELEPSKAIWGYYAMTPQEQDKLNGNEKFCKLMNDIADKYDKQSGQIVGAGCDPNHESKDNTIVKLTVLDPREYKVPYYAALDGDHVKEIFQQNSKTINTLPGKVREYSRLQPKTDRAYDLGRSIEDALRARGIKVENQLREDPKRFDNVIGIGKTTDTTPKGKDVSISFDDPSEPGRPTSVVLQEYQRAPNSDTLIMSQPETFFPKHKTGDEYNKSQPEMQSTYFKMAYHQNFIRELAKYCRHEEVSADFKKQMAKLDKEQVREAPLIKSARAQ